MENVTTGHWIFAAIFAVAFIGAMIWSYRKDLKLHKIQYKGSTIFFFSIIVFLIFTFIFRKYLQ